MFEVTIPKITDSELMERYAQIKPIIRKGGTLKWVKGYSDVEDLKEKAYLREPEYLRDVSKDELTAITFFDFPCLYKKMAGFPNLTIAGVLSQLDYQEAQDIMLYKPSTGKVIGSKIVAFEIIDPPKEDEGYITGALLDMGYYVSYVRLYASCDAYTGFPKEA